MGGFGGLYLSLFLSLESVGLTHFGGGDEAVAYT
jgi:hypothetical protein